MPAATLSHTARWTDCESIDLGRPTACWTKRAACRLMTHRQTALEPPARVVPMMVTHRSWARRACPLQLPMPHPRRATTELESAWSAWPVINSQTWLRSPATAGAFPLQATARFHFSEPHPELSWVLRPVYFPLFFMVIPPSKADQRKSNTQRRSTLAITNAPPLLVAQPLRSISEKETYGVGLRTAGDSPAVCFLGLVFWDQLTLQRASS